LASHGEEVSLIDVVEDGIAAEIRWWLSGCGQVDLTPKKASRKPCLSIPELKGA
jgi:Fe/S biogenesis protein NfuA